MGCSIFVGFKPLCQHVPPAFIYWLIGEGVSYITGAVFYSFPKLPYMHSVFHLFVLGGTVCHMMALCTFYNLPIFNKLSVLGNFLFIF